MRSISDNGRTTRFVYDDSGTRVIKTGAQGETVYVNEKWTVRNRSVGTKHVYVGSTRIASKLSPGDAHVRPDAPDLMSMMLGKWWEHRSTNGHQHGRNVEKNPHYEVLSEMPDDGMPDTNFVYVYHPDHVGSTSYVTDVDGELYEHVQYFPSGEPWVDQRSNTERLPYLFSGKELDQETGLSYFGARYYDPRVGLWASSDPAATTYLDGSTGLGGVFLPVNLASYAYAGHNPQKYTDPDGRAINLVAAGIGAAAGTLIGGGVELGRQLWKGDTVNWKRVGASAAGGFVAGGLAGLTGGATLVANAGVNLAAQGAMAGVGSAAGGTVTRTLLGEKTTAGDLVQDGVVGVATFGVMKGAGALWQRAAPAAAGGSRCPGCGICFAPGTQVLMADGSTKAIEDIEPGDYVVSDEPDDALPPSARRVTEVHRTATYRLFHIRVGEDENGEVLATGRHPFWTKRGWIAAEELSHWDVLLTTSGEWVPIRSIAEESRDTPTYNLSVEELHTYFVVAGETPLLVHNVDPFDIMFTQSNYGSTFSDGPWAGRTVQEAIEEARTLGRLPDGLKLNAVRMGDGTWATLNNRTLAVARGANLPNVDPVEAGPKGLNKLNQLLRNSGLAGPIDHAEMRCK